jgi:hypothetical protein
MNALIMALALATGPGINEDSPLPRSLAESIPAIAETVLPSSLAEPLVEPAAAPVDPQWWIGGHLAITYIYGNADRGGFELGGQVRVKILPWLAAEASLDFDIIFFNGGTLGVPIRVAALFYPPVEGTIHPYGIAGFGIAIYGNGLGTFGDFIIGGGAEFELQPNIMLDASIRFNFITDSYGGGGLDNLEFLFGILIKLSK